MTRSAAEVARDEDIDVKVLVEYISFRKGMIYTQ
jgi:hypothetical protein